MSRFTCIVGALLLALCGLLANSTQACQGSSCLNPQPGFSCPPGKVWDVGAICVECRGVQPAPESQVVACPGGIPGQITQVRQFSCVANTWQQGGWQTVSNTCVCPPPAVWNGTRCESPGGGGRDVCPNLPGVQETVPPGYVLVGDVCVREPPGIDGCQGPTFAAGPTLMADCYCEYGFDFLNQRSWRWQSYPAVGRIMSVYDIVSGQLIFGLSFQGPRYDVCP